MFQPERSTIPAYHQQRPEIPPPKNESDLRMEKIEEENYDMGKKLQDNVKIQNAYPSNINVTQYSFWNQDDRISTSNARRSLGKFSQPEMFTKNGSYLPSTATESQFLYTSYTKQANSVNPKNFGFSWLTPTNHVVNPNSTNLVRDVHADQRQVFEYYHGVEKRKDIKKGFVNRKWTRWGISTVGMVLIIAGCYYYYKKYYASSS